MTTLRIKGIQMEVGQTRTQNLPRILDKIKTCDCDFLLFPELSLTGDESEVSDSVLQESWEQIAAACRVSYVTGIVGTGSRANGKAHIQSRIFSDEGEVLGTHEKLVPTESDRSWCYPGAELRHFEHGDLSFGCLIGNDLWVAPGFGPYTDRRLSYQLGQRGVQVIFHSNQSGTDAQYAEYYAANLRLRARESRCYIVTVNAADPNGAVNVPSGVVGPDGEWLVRCPATGEQEFSYDLSLD